MDLGLLGIDGFTACKVIRKFSQAPIIMLTGRVPVSDKAFGMETGSDDYITKPFNLDEYWLGGARYSDAVATPTCATSTQRRWLTIPVNTSPTGA